MRRLIFARLFAALLAPCCLRSIAFGTVATLLPSVAQAVEPDWASFCERYTNEAVAQATKSKEMKCGYDGPRWDTKREGHFNWCLTKDGVFAEPTTEGLARVVGLKDCAAKKKVSGPPPGQDAVKSFAGVWDTQTSDGASYTLTLDQQGNGLVGAVDPKFDGTLRSTLGAGGKQLSFVLTQPGAGVTSRGNLSLSVDGGSVTGRLTKDTDGVPLVWNGKRRK